MPINKSVRDGTTFSIQPKHTHGFAKMNFLAITSIYSFKNNIRDFKAVNVTYKSQILMYIPICMC